MNSLKTLFAAITLLGCCSVSLAQTVALDVTNNTECYYLIQAVAIDPDCQNPCVTTQVCIGPNSFVQINPCSMIDSYVWCNVTITPATSNCVACMDVLPVTVAAPVDPCSSYPNGASGSHCDANCSNFNVDYSSATTLDIF